MRYTIRVMQYKKKNIEKFFLILLLTCFFSANFFGIFIHRVRAASWYDPSWPYRVKVTVDHTQVPADATDFPVYVDLSLLPAGFHTHVNQTDARDIRVTEDDGITEVPREVVSYASTTNTGELYFKAAGTLSSSIDTDFYIYYGNSGASDYAVSDPNGRNNVWDSYFEGVYHLPNGTSLKVNDSTGNANDGTNHGATATAGKIDGAANFVSASNQYIQTPLNKAMVGSNPTISLWMRPTGAQSTKGIMQIADGLTADNPFILLQRLNSTSISWYVNSNYRITQTVNDNTYYNISLIYDGTRWRAYKNGVADGTYRGALGSDLGSYTWLGNGYNGYYSGILDEVRISSINRSVNWLATEYNNLNANNTWWKTVGPEEHVAVPDAPTGLTPVSGNAQVSLTWTAPANDGGSAITDYLIEYKFTSTSTWSTFNDGISMATTTTVTGLTNGTSYDFRVSAVNAVGQGSASSVVTIALATVPGAPTITNVVGGNGQATVTFTPPASDGGSPITVYTVTATPVGKEVFDLSNGTLRIKDGGGAEVALTNDRVVASDLVFQNLSRAGTPGIVRVQFTLTYVNPSGRNEYDYQSKFVGSASLRQP